MQNLFDPATALSIISRVEQLQSNSAANWGKMNVAQMLAHCQQPFKVYFGEAKLKRGLIGFLFGGIAKKKLFTDKPWKQNLPTAKEFIITDERNFNAEKEKLVNLINRFSTETQNRANSVHPFFGKMTPQDWATLMYKHTDHHLKQFGV
jgi:hypothetical protein